MKYILLFFLWLYQTFFSHLLKMVLGAPLLCRFTPSCSLYASQVIQKYGIVRGMFLTSKRILACQPFLKR